MIKFNSVLLSVFSKLPFPVIYILSNILYYPLYYVFSYRTKVVHSNLLNAFPEKSEKERTVLAKKFYRYLCDLILESTKLENFTTEEIIKRVHAKNPQEVLRFLEKGQSVIIANGHYGNWEWGIPRLATMSKHPALFIYKPLTNKIFETVFNKARTNLGGIMVPMKQTIRKTVEYKDKAHSSVFLIDQTPTRQGSDYFIDFLNQPTLVFKGIEKIAQKTNYPVIYCHIDRVKRGYYAAEFTTLAENPQNSKENELTIQLNKFLEDIIKNKPELWLWSHKRWKHKPDHD